MADTFTANLAMILPDLGDTFDFNAHVIANFTTLDTLFGAVQCTSTTRPSDTFAGQIIYETDSKRYAQNTGTKLSPVWTYMSHAAMTATAASRPTSGRSTGQLIYETDTTRLLAWNGSSWEQKSFANFVTTSSAHPASPFQGLEIYETDTGLSAVYTGSNYAYGLQQVAPTQKLGVSAASVTFTGIPSNINHLVLLFKTQTTTSGTGNVVLTAQVNGDTTSAHYVEQYLEAVGASTSLGYATNPGFQIAFLPTTGVAGFSANQFAAGMMTLVGWGDNTTYLSGFTVSNAQTTTAGRLGVYSATWTQLATKTSITIVPASGSLAAGSWFSLLGVM